MYGFLKKDHGKSTGLPLNLYGITTVLLGGASASVSPIRYNVYLSTAWVYKLKMLQCTCDVQDCCVCHTCMPLSVTIAVSSAKIAKVKNIL